MRVCYYALRTLVVGADERHIGDLVPEAAAWPFLPGYIRDGYVAPVLVATLPEKHQQMLREWEAAQDAAAQVAGQTPGTPSAEGDTTTGDQPAATKNRQKEKVSA